MNKPFLKFYEDHADREIVHGLCHAFSVVNPNTTVLNVKLSRATKERTYYIASELIDLFEPSIKEKRYLPSSAFWGDERTDRRYTGNWNGWSVTREFNAFRQNVILFCAAMNGELK